MKIKIESLLDGAARATGTVVIIDVFRAFTTACLAFRQGAERMVLFEGVDEARAFARARDGYVLMGEVHGVKPDDFDYGNSPAEIAGVDFMGKTLVQSTRAGTTGVTRVPQPAEILVASFQNARATAQYLLTAQPNEVTIVAMGWEGGERTEEDELCALYIRGLLEEAPYELPFDAIRRLIATTPDGTKFADPEQPQFHPDDLAHCLELNATPLAIRVAREMIDGVDALVAGAVGPG